MTPKEHKLDSLIEESIEQFKDYRDFESRKDWGRIKSKIAKRRRARVIALTLTSTGIAAAVLVAIVTQISTAKLTDTQTTQPVTSLHTPPAPKVAPHIAMAPKTAAQLILSDGRTIDVKEQKGEIKEANSIISNTGQQLKYDNTPSSSSPAVDSLRYHTLKIPAGNIFVVMLTDGTKVTLNSSSQLKYPANFSQSSREVYLEGEALFEVTKKEGIPFIVHCHNQSIRVLGTSFNISSYKDDNRSTTSLLSGTILVERTKDTLAIQPGMVAVVQADSINAKYSDVEFNTAWINNKFNFADEPFNLILKQFERWYDVSFNISDSIHMEQYKFSGSLPKYKDISQLLEVIENMSNFKMTKAGKTINVSMINICE